MLITSVEELSNKKYRICLDEKETILLYKGEARRLHLLEGQTLSEEQYAEIIDSIIKKRARNRALHLLERQDRTERQLYDKLKQSEYPEKVIEDAIAYVKSYNYVDDKRYAVQYIKSVSSRKSRRQIIVDLQRKGINKEVITTAISEMETLDFDNQDKVLIRKWIEKKVKNEDVTVKEYQKIFRFLLGKGFSYEMIGKELAHFHRILDR